MAITCIKFAASMRRTPEEHIKASAGPSKHQQDYTVRLVGKKRSPEFPGAFLSTAEIQNIFRYPMMRRLDSSPQSGEEMKYSVMETSYSEENHIQRKETTTEIPPISNPRQ